MCLLATLLAALGSDLLGLFLERQSLLNASQHSPLYRAQILKTLEKAPRSVMIPSNQPEPIQLDLCPTDNWRNKNFVIPVTVTPGWQNNQMLCVVSQFFGRVVIKRYVHMYLQARCHFSLGLFPRRELVCRPDPCCKGMLNHTRAVLPLLKRSIASATQAEYPLAMNLNAIVCNATNTQTVEQTSFFNGYARDLCLRLWSLKSALQRWPSWHRRLGST